MQMAGHPRCGTLSHRHQVREAHISHRNPLQQQHQHQQQLRQLRQQCTKHRAHAKMSSGSSRSAAPNPSHTFPAHGVQAHAQLAGGLQQCTALLPSLLMNTAPTSQYILVCTQEHGSIGATSPKSGDNFCVSVLGGEGGGAGVCGQALARFPPLCCTLHWCSTDHDGRVL